MSKAMLPSHSLPHGASTLHVHGCLSRCHLVRTHAVERDAWSSVLSPWWSSVLSPWLQIQKIMMEFEKQNEMMGMKEEMMGDAMDDAFGDNDDEEEEEAIVGAVLAELNVGVASSMATTTGAKQAAGAGAAEQGAVPLAAADGGGAGAEDLDAELQKRLDNLRRT